MIDCIAQGEECRNKDEIGGLSNSITKFDESAEIYLKVATCFKIQKSWVQAGSTYIKLAQCHLKTDSINEAAAAYIDAANCYKKIYPMQAISSLEQAVNLFCNNGSLCMAAKYSKEIGEVYEQMKDFEEAIKYFERAIEFSMGESSPTFANQCKQKVAQFSAQLKQYTKAIEMFEEVAREAINSNLLRYGVRGHLLNAGICLLCRGDIVAIANALKRYQDLDPTFSRTREYELLTELVAAYHEKDVEKFTEVLKDYDSLSPLVHTLSQHMYSLVPIICPIDSWKKILLLRIKEDLKAISILLVS